MTHPRTSSRPRAGRPRRLQAWWLIVALLLAGCGGRPAQPARPESVATGAGSASAGAAVSRQPIPTQADEGGITTDEPVLATASATAPPAPAGEPAAKGQATPLATVGPAPPAPELPAPLPATTVPAPATDTPAVASVTPVAAPVTPATSFPSTDPYPLQIEVMRQQTYRGSEIVFEQTLAPGPNYNQYIVSYISDGYKIHALMTVPAGQKPATGWPAIIFNHGFIPPAQYRTTERYVAYVAAIARSGYIVFKSDYRGHGSSEGPPEGGYGGPGYTDDVLNALASVKAYKDTDPARIGIWGHSMGGQLTLRSMVVSKDIKAGVIWGGVVAPYPDIFARSASPRPTRVAPTRVPSTPRPGEFGPYGRPWRQELQAKYGTPEQNPGFWASISPNSYLADISGPLQLQASITDEEVPVEASQTLYREMQAASKNVELYTYPGDNHNISGNFTLAMQRTVAFFDKYVKGP